MSRQFQSIRSFSSPSSLKDFHHEHITKKSRIMTDSDYENESSKSDPVLQRLDHAAMLFGYNPVGSHTGIEHKTHTWDYPVALQTITDGLMNAIIKREEREINLDDDTVKSFQIPFYALYTIRQKINNYEEALGTIRDWKLKKTKSYKQTFQDLIEEAKSTGFYNTLQSAYTSLQLYKNMNDHAKLLKMLVEQALMFFDENWSKCSEITEEIQRMVQELFANASADEDED